MLLKKNTATQYVYFMLTKASDNTALTGASVTGYRYIDGAAEAAVTGTVSEDAHGTYHLVTSAADTNGTTIGYTFTASTAKPVTVTLLTTAADLSDTVRLGLTSLPNAAANAANGLLTNGTSTGQLSVASGVAQADVAKIRGTTSAGAVGKVALDLTQAVGSTQTSETLGECLYAARTQTYGKWVVSGTSLTLYAANGTDVVKTLTLDSSTNPTQRA